MKTIKYFFPNLLTSLNIIAGALAVVKAIEGYNLFPVYLLLIAAFFDFLDGFIAKILNATSEFGKQLDSLADLISFGFAPSVLLYKLMEASISKTDDIDSIFMQSGIIHYVFMYISFVFLIFAAMRLARFNIQTEKSDDFIGLPVPAATLFIISIWIIINTNSSVSLQNILLNKYVLVFINLLLSFLMISRVSMLSLKFTGIKLKDNMWRYALVAGIIVLFVLYKFQALYTIMLYYLLLSFTKVFFKKVG
jgi:CDP-diacylglycerol--serine O-phosphatidyltransferase